MTRRPVRPRSPEETAPAVLFTEEDRRVAWRAIQNLQKLMPQMNHFARYVTGKPNITVKITGGVPGSQGNVISIRPPLGLGKDTVHDRSNCGARDKSARQICPACRAREVVEFFLFHEIAHAAFGTHVKPNYADRRIAEQFLNEWHPASVCNHARLIRQKMEKKSDPLNFADALHPFLATFFNALEDPRVNLRMFDARPGMRIVFDLNLDALMSEGTEIGIDKFVTWSTAPLNSQFMVGLMYAASGRSSEGILRPVVVEALDDQRIQSICAQVPNAKDAHEIFKLAVEAFRVAQDLGYCLVEKCEPPPPSLGMPGDPSGGEGTGEADKSDAGDQPDKGDEFGDSGGGTSSESTSGTESDLPTGDDLSGPPPGLPEDDEADGDGAESQEGDKGADSGEGTDGEDSSSGPDSGSDDRGTPEPGSDEDGSDPEGPDDSPDEAGQDGSGGQGSEEPGHNEDSGGSHDGDTDGDELDAGSSGSEEQDNQAGSFGENPDKDGQSEDNGLPSGPDESGNPREDTTEPIGDEGNSESEAGGKPDEVSEGDALESGKPQADEGPPEVKDEVAENPWLTEGPDATDAPFGPPTTDGGDVSSPPPVPGTPEDIARDIARFLMHGSDGHDGFLDQMADGDHEKLVGISEDGELPEYIKQLIKIALSQVDHFDSASMNVAGVEKVPFPHLGIGWTRYYGPHDFAPAERLMGGAVLLARRVFEDNKRSRLEVNKKSGRIDTRVLGRRAAMGDPRLFARKYTPGRKDYFVIIGADCSGSTARHGRNQKIKRAVHAQADLLTRVGVPWVGYGHTAYTSPLVTFPYAGKVPAYYVYILPFKGERDAWNDEAKERLANIVPVSDNLDGHTLEFYRKIAQRSTATDKVIIYYTDGEMPAANYDEEKEILERELRTCERLGITVLGVGINTNSPSAYGMDTVRIDSDADIHKVLTQLERRLMR